MAALEPHASEHADEAAKELFAERRERHLEPTAAEVQHITSARLYAAADALRSRANAMDEADRCMDALRNAESSLRRAAGWLVDAEQYAPAEVLADERDRLIAELNVDLE